MNCEKCGKWVSSRAAYCPTCGHRLKREEEQGNADPRRLLAAALIVAAVVLALLPILGGQETRQSTPEPQPEPSPTIPETAPEESAEETAEETVREETSVPYLPLTPSTEESPEQKVLGTSTEEANGTVTTTRYSYDMHGKLLREIRGEGERITEYSYDDDGTLQQIVSCGEEGPYEVTEYRADGTLLRQTAYTYSTEGNLTQTLVTVFDSHGNSQSQTCTREDGVGGYAMTYTNTYDSQGRLTCRDTMVEQGGLMHRDRYTYGADGSYTWESAEYGGYDGNSYWQHVVNTYDSEGKLLTESWDTVDGVECRREITYSYDRQGNLLHVLTRMGESTQEEAYDNDYDADGNLVRVTLYASGEKQWERTYEYDRGWVSAVYCTGADGETELEEAWVYYSDGRVYRHTEGNTVCTYVYVPLSEVMDEA